MILSTGLEVVSGAKPQPPLVAPTHLHATMDKIPGGIRLTYTVVNGTS